MATFGKQTHLTQKPINPEKIKNTQKPTPWRDFFESDFLTLVNEIQNPFVTLTVGSISKRIKDREKQGPFIQRDCVNETDKCVSLPQSDGDQKLVTKSKWQFSRTSLSHSGGYWQVPAQIYDPPPHHSPSPQIKGSIFI